MYLARQVYRLKADKPRPVPRPALEARRYSTDPPQPNKPTPPPTGAGRGSLKLDSLNIQASARPSRRPAPGFDKSATRAPSTIPGANLSAAAAAAATAASTGTEAAPLASDEAPKSASAALADALEQPTDPDAVATEEDDDEFGETPEDSFLKLESVYEDEEFDLDHPDEEDDVDDDDEGPEEERMEEDSGESEAYSAEQAKFDEQTKIKREIDKRREERLKRKTTTDFYGPRPDDRIWPAALNLKNLDDAPEDPLWKQLTDPQTGLMPDPSTIDAEQGIYEVMGPSAIKKLLPEDAELDAIDYNPNELEDLTANEVVEHAQMDMESERAGDAWMRDIYIDEHTMVDNLMNRQAHIDDLFQQWEFNYGPLGDDILKTAKKDVYRDLKEGPTERVNHMRETLTALWHDRMQLGSELLDDFAYWRQKKALKQAQRDKYKAKYLEKAKDKIAAKLAKRSERAKKLDEERRRLYSERRNDPNWIYSHELKMWFSKEQLKNPLVRGAVQAMPLNPTYNWAQKAKFVQSVVTFNKSLENIPEEDKQHIRTLWAMPQVPEKPLIEQEHHLKLPYTDWNKLIAEAEAQMDERERADRYPDMKKVKPKKSVTAAKIEALVEKIKNKSAAPAAAPVATKETKDPTKGAEGKKKVKEAKA